MAKQTFTVGQVLTASQLTSLQATAMSGGAASAKTTSYVLVAADAGTAISMTSTSATTITVNTGLFAAGDTVFIQNLGTANLTITAGTATVNTAGSLILPQYDAGILYFVSSSSAVFYDYIQTGATSPLTTKGDLYGFGTSDARIPIGTNGHILTADSAETLGLKWAAPAGGGKVLQVIQDLQTGLVQTTSTSFQSTGLSVSITPSSATSKVLVLGSISIAKTAGANATSVKLQIKRGATAIMDMGAQSAFTNDSSSNDVGFSAICFLDSPSTTSATTYAIEFASSVSGQTVYVNNYGPTDTVVSSIVVMEIGA